MLPPPQSDTEVDVGEADWEDKEEDKDERWMGQIKDLCICNVGFVTVTQTGPFFKLVEITPNSDHLSLTSV